MLRGDEPAFERFFDVAYPAMYRFALARLDFDRDTAAEIAQPTVCKAMRNLRTLSRRSRAAHLGVHDLPQRAVRVRRNVTAEVQRGARGRRPRSPRGARVVAGSETEDLDALLDRKKVASLVQRVLDHLPPHYADALEWKYIDELTVQEIAQRLGLGTKAAESLLTRARRAFGEAFRDMVDA